jgi:hypothetical protein
MKDGRLELTYRGERVVADTTCLPWEIRDPARDHLLQWSVLLAAPSLRIDTFVVLGSRDDVADMDQGSVPEELLATLFGFFDNRAQEGPKERERDKRNAAYRKLADETGLPVGSRELFDLAIERATLDSLVLLDGTENEVQVIEDYSPSLPKEFEARWAHSEGESTLYDWPDPKAWPDLGKIEYIYGGCTRLPIAFVTRAAETHH